MLLLARTSLFSASRAAQNLKYATHDGRHLLAAVLHCEDLADFQHHITIAKTQHRSNTPFVSLTIPDLSDEPRDPYAVIRAIQDSLAEAFPEQPSLTLLHGPPSEDVRLHGHALVEHLDTNGPCSIRSYRTRFNAALRRVRGAAFPPYVGTRNPDFGGLSRDDTYSFIEWLRFQGFSDDIDNAGTPLQIAQTLAYYRLSRVPSDSGYAIRDDSSPEHLHIKAYRCKLSDGDLLKRFGTTVLPIVPPPADTRSFYKERSSKYSVELHSLHDEARTRWQSEFGNAIDAQESAIRDTYRNVYHHREGATGHILKVTGLARTPRNLAAASRYLAERIRAARAADIRDLHEAYPRQPGKRISDWLKQLYQGNPEPLADIPGALLRPGHGTGHRVRLGPLDRELYDENDVVIAHENYGEQKPGVQLRHFDALRSISDVRAIYVKHGYAEQAQAHVLDPNVEIIERPPRAIPPGIQAALERQGRLPTWLWSRVDMADPTELEGDDALEFEPEETERYRSLNRRGRTPGQTTRKLKR